MSRSEALRLARDFLARPHPIFSVLGYCVVGVIVALSVMPADDRPVTGAGSGLEHIAAFSIAGGLFAIANTVSAARLAAYAVIACALLEILQMTVPTRHARPSDFLLDVAASLAAIGIVAGLRRLSRNEGPGEASGLQ